MSMGQRFGVALRRSPKAKSEKISLILGAVRWQAISFVGYLFYGVSHRGFVLLARPSFRVAHSFRG
jgi:hypothetical protein